MDNKQDRRLQQQFIQELDDFLFDDMQLDDHKKKEWVTMIKQQGNVTKQAGGSRRESENWFKKYRKQVMAGMTAAVAVLGIGLAVWQLDLIPMKPGTVPISSEPNTAIDTPVPDGGHQQGGGTAVSSLVTDVVATSDEARDRFGTPFALPGALLEAYEIGEIQVIGYPNQDALRVHFSFAAAGEEPSLYSVDKQEAAFGVDLFEAVDLGNGVSGKIYVQETLTELYWQHNGLHYSIVGPIREEQALHLAQAAVQ